MRVDLRRGVSLCPSISCKMRRSPASSRCVAKLWRKACGCSPSSPHALACTSSDHLARPRVGQGHPRVEQHPPAPPGVLPPGGTPPPRRGASRAPPCRTQQRGRCFRRCSPAAHAHDTLIQQQAGKVERPHKVSLTRQHRNERPRMALSSQPGGRGGNGCPAAHSVLLDRHRLGQAGGA